MKTLTLSRRLRFKIHHRFKDDRGLFLAGSTQTADAIPSCGTVVTFDGVRYRVLETERIRVLPPVMDLKIPFGMRVEFAEENN